METYASTLRARETFILLVLWERGRLSHYQNEDKELVVFGPWHLRIADHTKYQMTDRRTPQPNSSSILHWSHQCTTPVLSDVHQVLGLFSTALFSAHGSNAVIVRGQNAGNSHQCVRDCLMDMSRDQNRKRERRKREK